MGESKPWIGKWYRDQRRIRAAVEAKIALSHSADCSCFVCQRVRERIHKRPAQASPVSGAKPQYREVDDGLYDEC